MRVPAALLAFLVALSSFAARPKIGAEVYRDLATDDRVQVIVMLEERAKSKVSIRELRESVISATPEVSVVRSWSTVPGFAALIGRDALAALEENPNVAKVDLDAGGGHGLAQSVPLIRGDVARNLGYTGKGVTIAVVDSGVDLTHPDLREAIAAEACFCDSCCPNGSSTQFGPGAGRDEDGHGTNVAGIALSRGRFPGVAPEARLVVVRVLDRDGRFGSTSQIVSALEWIQEEHPEVKVVNMSLLTEQRFSGVCDNAASHTMAMARAINNLRAAGVSVFACSGNARDTARLPSPACIANAISVGAVWKMELGSRTVLDCTDNTTAADKITCFSNTNSTLDLLAPGAPIIASGLGGGSSSYAGTSQATPHAAGAAAVLLGKNPTLQPQDIETILKNTGKLILDPRIGLSTPRIDVAAAVQAAPNPVYGPRRRSVRH